MELKYSKSLYSKEALLKAAFHFTGMAYLYLHQDKENYLVDVTPKEGDLSEDFAEKFSNELLAQTVHVMVARETSQLRSILIGRALSSTMIMQQSEPEADDKEKPSEELDSILKDWFEQNEKD